MRVSTGLYLIAAALTSFSCSNLEDAKPSDRNTFIKVYEGPNGYTAASIDKQPDGYVMLCNSVTDEGNPVMVVFTTDAHGARTSEASYIEGYTGNGIKTLPGGGYVIVADSTDNQANPENANDFKIVSAQVIMLNNGLDVVKTFVKKDTKPEPGKTDFRTTGVNVTADGKIIILGTYQESENDPIKPYVMTWNPNEDPQNAWFKKYDLLDKDYQNARSVYYSNGKIIWASAVAQEQQNFNFSYVNVPLIEEGSVFTNYSLLGQTTEQLMLATDISASKLDNSGFGVVGTYGTTTKTAKNMFFFRVNNEGVITPGSLHYYDAVSGDTGNTQSTIEDTGEAIGSTADGGFVIGGQMITTPEKGNGAGDIVLMRIDPIGNLQWSKTLGGSGDELVRGILETEDNQIIIFGTNTIGGFPSVFLIRTDSNGELKN